MTKISISEGTLILEVQGWDKLWSLKSRLEVPLAHVSAVRRAADERPRGIRLPGTHVPGLITAGSFLQEGRWVFWDVHDSEKAIAIDLQDEHFTALVVEVADPEASIRDIARAVTPALRAG
jgi:quinol monooxygenase YgiN